LACVLAPRTWQERTSKAAAATRNRGYAWRYGGAKRREGLRRNLLSRDPILWLACRERWQTLGMWVLTVVIIAGFMVLLLLDVGYEVWFGWEYVSRLFKLVLYLAMASQACRFFVEARRTGLIELLLAAPLTERAIVRGQIAGLMRMFGLPLLLLLIVQMAGACLSHGSWRYMYTQIGGGTAPQAFLGVLVAGLAGVTTAANLIALCFFGMWMGMTSKNTNMATLKTILFVQIIPWLVITFASSMVSMLVLMPWLMQKTGGGGPGQVMVWYPLISAALGASLAIAKDAGFYFWARGRLYSGFREQAARGTGPLPSVSRPVALAPVPPRIAAAQP
jgi:hypothetical protein